MFRPQVARSARTLGRRANSTTAQQAQQKAQQAAQDAKQAAGDVAAKAKDALNSPKAQEVSQKANELFESGAQAVRKVTGPIGDKVGNALGCEYESTACRTRRRSHGRRRWVSHFSARQYHRAYPPANYGT